MGKERICNHRILAGFISFLMFFSLLFGGIALSLKSGILGAGGLKAIIEDEKVYSILHEFLDDTLDESFEDSGVSWILENENFTEIKEEMILLVVDLMLEETDEIDVDHIMDMMSDTIEKEADTIVDDVLDEIENVGEDFEARDNEYVNEVVKRYELEVSESFYDEINSYAQHADNIDEYRDEIKQEVQTQVIEPAKAETENHKEDIEKSMRDMLDDYYDSEAFDTVSTVNGVFGMVSTLTLIAAIACLTVSAVFMVILCILYKKGIFGAFSKLAVNTGIVGVMLILVGMVKGLAMSLIDDAVVNVDKDVVESVEKILEYIVGSVFTPFTVVGIVFIVIMVASIVVWAVTKSIYNNKKNSSMYDGMNSNMYNTNMYNGEDSYR